MRYLVIRVLIEGAKTLARVVDLREEQFPCLIVETEENGPRIKVEIIDFCDQIEVAKAEAKKAETADPYVFS